MGNFSISSCLLGASLTLMLCIFVMLAFIARELSAIHAADCRTISPPISEAWRPVYEKSRTKP